MTQIISSQRYLEDEIIKEKIESEDFEVLVSPKFDIDGETYQVIIDGHHSYHAAIKTGNTPIYTVASCQDSDNVAILEYDNDPERFLETAYIDSDYYDIETDIDIW